MFNQSTLRRQITRGKHTPAHSISPTSEASEQPRRPPTEDERRLTSSDLEDCEEIWIGELSEYMLETRKRQNQVAEWFEANIAVGRIQHIWTLFDYLHTGPQHFDSSANVTLLCEPNR